MLKKSCPQINAYGIIRLEGTFSLHKLIKTQFRRLAIAFDKQSPVRRQEAHALVEHLWKTCKMPVETLWNQ
jgi:hypothetical protein